MELLLGVALAVSVVALAWIQNTRAVERARMHRLENELAALRRAPSASLLGAPPSDAAESPDGAAEEAAPAPPRPEPAPTEPAAPPRAHGGERDGSRDGIRVDVEPGNLLGAAADRLDRALRELGPALASIDAAARSALGPPEEPESALLAPVPRTASADEPVSLAVRTAEEMADERARLDDDLRSVGQALERALDGSRAANAALEQVARQAAAFPGLAAALSGLADRTNLLALNLALHGTRSGGEGPTMEEAATEMRGIFEEARRLSREVGELAQRTTASASKSAELFADVTAAASAGDERGRRARARVAGLSSLGARLRAAFEATLEAGRRQEEEARALARRVELTSAALAARAAEGRARYQQREELRSHALRAAEGLHELSDAARGLVDAVEQAGERRPPARPA